MVSHKLTTYLTWSLTIAWKYYGLEVHGRIHHTCAHDVHAQDSSYINILGKLRANHIGDSSIVASICMVTYPSHPSWPSVDHNIHHHAWYNVQRLLCLNLQPLIMFSFFHFEMWVRYHFKAIENANPRNITHFPSPSYVHRIEGENTTNQHACVSCRLIYTYVRSLNAHSGQVAKSLILGGNLGVLKKSMRNCTSSYTVSLWKMSKICEKYLFYFILFWKIKNWKRYNLPTGPTLPKIRCGQRYVFLIMVSNDWSGSKRK
jgi:hypothetical protein